LEYPLHSHHHSSANHWRAHAKIFSLQNGGRGRSDLRRICFCYGLTDSVVSTIWPRFLWAMDWSRLSGSTGKHSSLLRHDRDLHIDLFNRRSFLPAARLSVRCRDDSKGSGGVVCRAMLRFLLYV